MKNVFSLFSKPKQKELTMNIAIMKPDLENISSAVSRGAAALKALAFDNAALVAKGIEAQAKIDELTAILEAAIPDAGGSTGGVVG
jgi:hypothetical protein